MYTCELRYHGEQSVDAQILDNGELYIVRRFDTPGGRGAGGPGSSGQRLKKASA